MKKLMFATALVASAAAFADPINALSFEGYTADTGVGSGVGDVPETGNATGNAYFWFDGEADASLVKTYGNDNLLAPAITRPLWFATTLGNTNAKYLELSTEGGTLWRSLGVSDSTGMGAEQNVAATGVYLDTLVQFTPTEDGGEPTLEGDDKLAIWLNVDSSTSTPVTNLMVRAAYVDDNGTSTSATATNFILATASPVVAGNWYRLTVKAIADVTQCKAKNGEYNPNGITGFEIYLDGVQLAATESTIGSGYIDRAVDASEYGWLDESTDADFIAYLQSGKVFPSLKGETSNSTLQAVGFKGSGALDDLVWTTEDPFAGGSGGETAAWIDNVVTVFTGADLSSAQKEDITAWASANNITVASGKEEIAAAAYLLGLTDLPAAVPDLTITSIEEGTTAWTLTVAASVNDSALALPATINGAITLKQAATLAGLSSASATVAPFTIANGTATVTVAKDAAAAKFMKVGVGIAPAQ